MTAAYAVVSDTDGRVVRTGRCPADQIGYQAWTDETAYPLTDEEAALVRAPHWVRSGGAWVSSPVEPPLGDLKALLTASVDHQAEQARQRFITPGSGQALEYEATEREARVFVDAVSPDLADYPFLAAEVLAQEDVGGATPDPSDVAAEIISQADAWKTVGSAIKRLRRSAKLAIEASSTHAEARAAAQVTWPSA